MDKAAFIMYGARAYTGLAKKLFVHLGWDADGICSIGGFSHTRAREETNLIVPSKDSSDGKLSLM